MLDYREYFKGKRVTLMGLGLLGRGIGDAAFLAECGAVVTVTDKKTDAELATSVEKLKKYPNITFHLGGHRMEDFTNADLVIKSAKVRLDSPEIAAAKNAGVEIAMSTALFAKFALEAGVRIVGVTGTRGKTTVTQMINHSLLSAGRKTILGGNIRGLSTLALTPEISPEKIIVLELDSWQLQGFGDLRMSPHVAVFTNLMPDHQDYYASMDEYFLDKSNIFKFQSAADTLIVGAQVLARVKTIDSKNTPQVPLPIPAFWQLNVIGEHNRENASLAAAALYALGLSEEEVKTGLESFKPVEGRLQFLRDVRGIKIYNDNNATTPEATIVALRALGSRITLICGGSEKGLDLKELVQEIKTRVSHLVVLTHSNYKGSDRLIGKLQAARVAFETAENLSQAVQMGIKGANTLLFSPGFASFGMFNNEYERNDQFVRLIQDLQ